MLERRAEACSSYLMVALSFGLRLEPDEAYSTPTSQVGQDEAMATDDYQCALTSIYVSEGGGCDGIDQGS